MSAPKLGEKVVEGKTKTVHRLPERPGHVWVESKDSITAGDGARRNVIEGKGVIANGTACSLFQFLNNCGVKTHFVEKSR